MQCGPFPKCLQVSYFIHVYKSLYPGLYGSGILYSAIANMPILKKPVYFQPSNNWVKIKNKNHPPTPDCFKNWMRIYLFIWYGINQDLNFQIKMMLNDLQMFNILLSICASIYWFKNCNVSRSTSFMKAFCSLLTHQSVNYFFALNDHDANTNVIPVSC